MAFNEAVNLKHVVRNSLRAKVFDEFLEDFSMLTTVFVGLEHFFKVFFSRVLRVELENNFKVRLKQVHIFIK